MLTDIQDFLWRNLYFHDIVWYQLHVYNVFCLSVMIYRANVLMHFGCLLPFNAECAYVCVRV